jgi:hypothetical protein
MTNYITVKSTEFLSKYPAVWSDENIENLNLDVDDDGFDFPTNLDPFTLDIEYKHGEIPEELEAFISGQFFIENIEQFEPFKIYFCTFFDAREIYFFEWDGKKLKKQVDEFADLIEERDDLDDDITWENFKDGNLDDEFMPEEIDDVIFPKN